MSIQSGEFYVTGGTLRHDALSYVERTADRDLLASLERTEFCYVLTSRQMGKSSLMVRTAAKLRSAGTAVAVLDLTAIGQNLTPDQWYGGLLRRLGRQLDPKGELEENLDNFWQAQECLGPLQRWIAAIEKYALTAVSGPVVIFLDEIDAVRNLPFSTDEFFAAIRECYNRRTDHHPFRRLTFCLLGVATPSDLIRDTRMTPFNIGTRIELEDFTPVETLALTEGLGREKRTAARLIQRILFWTAGHPYLTQRLCQATARDKTIQDTTALDRLCTTLFLSPSAREKDDNLLFVRERLLRSEVDQAALLDLYARVHSGSRRKTDESNQLVGVLRLSGVARIVEGILLVRNRIYSRVFDQTWVRAHMPDAEMQRQKAAFRRGILRTISVSGVALAAMGFLVVRATTSEGAATRARNDALISATTASTARSLAMTAQARAEQSAASEAAQRLRAVALARTADESARAAKREAARAKGALAAAQEARATALTAARSEAQQRGFAQQQYRVAQQTLYISQMQRAHDAWTSGLGESTTELLDAQVPKRGQRDYRGFEWYLLRSFSRDQSLDTFAFSKDNIDIAAVAISPDGATLATSDGKSTVLLWDIRSKRQIAHFNGHTDEISCAEFSPDGKLLATGSRDGTVRIWDLKGRRERNLFQVGGYVRCVRFASDGRRLATCSWSSIIKLYDVASGQLCLHIPNDANIRGSANSVAFFPDEEHIAVALRGSGAAIIDLRNGTAVRQLLGHDNQVWAIAVSPDGKLVATGSWDQTIRLWNSDTGERIATLKGRDGWILALAFSADSQRIVAGALDGAVVVWDVASRAQVSLRRGHHAAVENLAVSRDGTRIVTASKDCTAKIWSATDRRNSEPSASLVIPISLTDTRDVMVSPDHRQLAELNRNGSVTIRDLVTDEVQSLEGRQTGTMCFDRSCAMFYSLDELNTVHRLNLATHRAEKLFEFGPQVTNVQFSGQDNAYAFDSKGILTVFNFRTRDAHAFQIDPALTRLMLSPNGTRLLGQTHQTDGTRLWLWELARRRRVYLGSSKYGWSTTRFSPDSKVVIGAPTQNAVTWIWKAPEYRAIPVVGHSDELFSHAIAISPDSRLLAIGSQDRLICIWTLGDGRLLAKMVGHALAVRSLSFSSNGRTLASLGEDGTVRLWDTKLQQEVGRYPTPELASYLEFSEVGESLMLRRDPEVRNPGLIHLWQASRVQH